MDRIDVEYHRDLKLVEKRVVNSLNQWKLRIKFMSNAYTLLSSYTMRRMHIAHVCVVYIIHDPSCI